MNGGGSARFATRRPAAVGAACAAALMAGAVGGVWAAGLAVPDERVEAPATRVVRAGAARIEVPQAWQTVRATGKSVVLAPSPPLRDRVILTVGAPDHASLVPASVRARTQDLGQGPRTVQLAGRPAWRYPGLVGRGGDEALDVTVLPGRDAVLSVACVASVRDALAAPDCAAGSPPSRSAAHRRSSPRRTSPSDCSSRGCSTRWIARAPRREPRSAPRTPAGPRPGGHAGWRPRTSAPRMRCGPWRQTAARR